MRTLRFRILLLAAALAVAGHGLGAQSVLRQPLDRYLESLRLRAAIPGLSAVLVQDGVVIWQNGFGFGDLEASVRATPDTPYYVADLTGTLAATALLRCVENGTASLDTPVAQYSNGIPEAGATLFHLLTHTSAGVPGSTFKFDPARFALLTPAIEQCTGHPFVRAIREWFIDRLAMIDTVPGQDLDSLDAAGQPLFNAATKLRYEAVLQRLATPYRIDKGRAVRSELPPKTLHAATGLIATAPDLARFDAAIDAGLLLLPETRLQAWTNVVSPAGVALPIGLGWFVQLHQGERIVWHFGSAIEGYSSLMIKVPARKLTFIALANSDGLSAPFQLSTGDVTQSFFARVFLGLFL